MSRLNVDKISTVDGLNMLTSTSSTYTGISVSGYASGDGTTLYNEFNISSLTDTTVGDKTFNFTTSYAGGGQYARSDYDVDANATASSNTAVEPGGTSLVSSVQIISARGGQAVNYLYSDYPVMIGISGNYS
jgi:hypothetical protein